MSPSRAFQDKLYQEEYQFVATEEEREEISRKLSEASSWMEDEGYAAPTKVRCHQCKAEKEPVGGSGRLDHMCTSRGFWVAVPSFPVTGHVGGGG